MTNLQTIDADEPDNLARHARNDGPVLGEWYWVRIDGDGHDYMEKPGRELVGHMGRSGDERLMCAMAVGSNYVELRTPEHCSNGYRSTRVHLENFWTDMRHEPDGIAVLTRWAKQQQLESHRLMAEIQALTARLGVSPVPAVEQDHGESTGGALVALSAAPDIDGYKRQLILAKEEQLPALYEHMKASNGNLAALLHAQALPMLARVGDMKETIKQIDGRIFSISLYAGLHEDAVLCKDGDPAAAHEKLHVMQSRLYMDEECLANYRHGGMEFKQIGEFDQWLCEPENLNRILPFPRTLVAMRVRRFEKNRVATDLRQALVNIDLARADELTFLYVRNGQQVWCIQSELDFDASIFPDRSAFDPKEPKMARVRHGGAVERFVGLSVWEDMCTRYDEAVALHNAWERKHKGDDEARFRNPHHIPFDNPHHDWHPVDHTSVFFDDAMAVINDQVQKYNRVAVIIQGLFDRSPILNPHPPVQSWTAEGFDRAIELVYDGSETLHNGEAPDFEAYRAMCNASMAVGSMAIGQEDVWELQEGERECARRDRDWRDRGGYRPTRYKPHGNPGPGYLARVENLSRTKGATFRWERERVMASRGWSATSSAMLPCTITVPLERLFNADAYRLGDFKQFFADRRTRAQYLQWAPLLIAAEEYAFKKQQELKPFE